MRPVVVSVGPLAAASANAIAQSQTLSGAGSLLINGAAAINGVAALDTPRRVAIASAGNDSGITFTITGTDRTKLPQSETLPGTNSGVAQSALDYATVTSIVTSGATASTVQAGTNGTASSAWARLDEYSTPSLGGQVVAPAGTTWAIEGTFDDPNNPTMPVAPAAVTWMTFQDSTAAGPLKIDASPLFARVTVTGGAGSARATLVQYSEVNQIKP